MQDLRREALRHQLISDTYQETGGTITHTRLCYVADISTMLYDCDDEVGNLLGKVESVSHAICAPRSLGSNQSNSHTAASCRLPSSDEDPS